MTICNTWWSRFAIESRLQRRGGKKRLLICDHFNFRNKIKSPPIYNANIGVYQFNCTSYWYHLIISYKLNYIYIMKYIYIILCWNCKNVIKCLTPFFILSQGVCRIQGFDQITIKYSSKIATFSGSRHLAESLSSICQSDISNRVLSFGYFLGWQD